MSSINNNNHLNLYVKIEGEEGYFPVSLDLSINSKDLFDILKNKMQEYCKEIEISPPTKWVFTYRNQCNINVRLIASGINYLQSNQEIKLAHLKNLSRGEKPNCLAEKPLAPVSSMPTSNDNNSNHDTKHQELKNNNSPNSNVEVVCNTRIEVISIILKVRTCGKSNF